MHNVLILIILNPVAHNAGHPESFLVGDKRIQLIFICTNAAHRDRNLSLDQVLGYCVLGGLGKFPCGKPDFLPTLGGFDPTKPTNSNNQMIFFIIAAHNMVDPMSHIPESRLNQNEFHDKMKLLHSIKPS